ncbi:MAG: carboxylesterase family protein, partial [Lachnospiraceae bacterium]|nr:carboxylesterase family protein [Lachnospiraceae bacterium]
MKKLLTIDDIMVSFISALGCGYGEAISRLLGWPDILCGAASLILGLIMGEIISRITFSEAVQRKPVNRILTYIACLLIFVIGHAVSMSWMGVSMVHYLLDEFKFTVAMPILGFVLNLIIRAYRVHKVREVYGDGKGGYVFYVKQEHVDEANRQNQSVLSEYDESCAVKTRTGVYVGEEDSDVISFLGIPYAKPPVGELRWKAPEPLPSSSAIFEAKYFGASAIQAEMEGSVLKLHRQSEDCLTLNIIVSHGDTETKKPVMVLFHNGDFSFGGSADPLLHGENFADDHPGVIFVSINYRLGIFGFIDFSDVPGGDAYPDAPNLGLLDQIAALKWIRENISAFGGDPDRITVLGFDAGATSILLLSVSGRAKGLFQRAFIFNGNPQGMYTAQEKTGNIAADLLRETNNSSMEGLSKLSSEALMEAARKLRRSTAAPTCDGAFIPADVYDALKDGAASGIEFVLGIPDREAYVIRSFMGNKNFEDAISDYMTEIKSSLDDQFPGDVREYIEKQASSGRLKIRSKLAEQWNALCICYSAACLSEAGNRVYLMNWAEKPLIKNLGSGSVDAAAALLGNSEALEMYGNVMKEDLSEILQLLLQKFVCGDPLELYNNEIKGVDAIEWGVFPKMLVVDE